MENEALLSTKMNSNGHILIEPGGCRLRTTVAGCIPQSNAEWRSLMGHRTSINTAIISWMAMWIDVLCRIRLFHSALDI